ncbi:unnamed protein product [Sympodiomycopsis kandeliae]
MKVIPVPVRDDNYAYVVVSTPDNNGVFVDPYTLSTVQKASDQAGVKKVIGCITTHHHHDHSGGNKDYKAQYPETSIWAGSDTPVMNTLVKDGTTFSIGENINVRCLATPCHTQDSIAFYLEDKRDEKDLASGEIKRGVFTGDTLFVSGCGRFFEGNATEMHTALNKTLSSLPDDTKVFVGHEYTKSNVAFSSGVLPDRPAIQSLVNDIQAGKNNGVTTGQYTIGDEKKHNIFMLVNDPEVQERLDTKGDAVKTMHMLRELKNAGKMMAKV